MEQNSMPSVEVERESDVWVGRREGVSEDEKLSKLGDVAVELKSLWERDDVVREVAETLLSDDEKGVVTMSQMEGVDGSEEEVWASAWVEVVRDGMWESDSHIYLSPKGCDVGESDERVTLGEREWVAEREMLSEEMSRVSSGEFQREVLGEDDE